MGRSKIVLVLTASVALTGSLLAGPAVAADGTNSGGPVTRSTAPIPRVAPDTEAGGCRQVVRPDAEYTGNTRVLDLSGIPDYTPVSALGRVQFSPTLEKRSVPDSWATWGTPPDTESATPHVLFSDDATSVEIKIRRGSNKIGFEVEPNPRDLHTITAVFSRNGTPLCTKIVDVRGDAGARLIAVSSRVRRFDSVTVSSDTDFSIAQVRYRPDHRSS
jgi:hypothetical protein